MLKVYNYDIVCQELPSEVTLALNISSCPIHCPGCHSQHLWEDVGEPLTEGLLDALIEQYDGDITAVCFMGGDSDHKAVEHLCNHIRFHHNELRTAWWSGRQEIPADIDLSLYDYIKVGPYIESLGGLKSPTTNQILYANRNGQLQKIHL